jgi:glycosyltransferase involved in cell wall biosynthesis
VDLVVGGATSRAARVTIGSAPTSLRLDRRIVWLADSFHEPTGYSDEARSFLTAFHRNGLELAARELAEPRLRITEDDASRDAVESGLARSPEQPLLAVHHYVPGVRPLDRGTAVAHVARTMFETDRVPAQWLSVLRQFDQVWVPSTYNRAHFVEAGLAPERVAVLAPTIDYQRFSPRPQPRAGRIRFLSVMRFSQRKGWRELLTAWRHAFSARDPVELRLLVTSIGFTPTSVQARFDEWLRHIAGPAWERTLAPLKIVLDPALDPDALADEYRAAHAYVSASRGEGWGRPLMEALTCGLPTVAPRLGGVLDFMSAADSWLVDGAMAPISADAELQPQYAHLYAGHRWFVVDEVALATAMADIAANYPAAWARAANARQRLMTSFNDERAASDLLSLSSDLLARIGRPSSLRSPDLPCWDAAKAEQQSGS